MSQTASQSTAPSADGVPPHRYTPALAQQIELAWQDRWDAEGTFATPNPVGPLSEPLKVYTNNPKQKLVQIPVSGFVRPVIAVVGTPMFMSPEQIFGQKDVDFRSDLWALAVLAYYALSGRAPFSGQNLEAFGNAIEEGRFEPITTLVPGLMRTGSH